MSEHSRLKPKAIRLWDTVGKRMLQPESFVFHGTDLRIVNGYSSNRFIILEWTTAKDDQGERIFEADFVRYESEIILVQWSGAGWNLKGRNGHVVGNWFTNKDLRQRHNAFR